jgi:hypothetical protein
MDLRIFVPFVAAMAATGIACAHASEPSAATTRHHPKSIILESGNLGKTLTKGYSNIEQASVYCGYSVCTLGLSMMSNVGTATCKSEWAIVGLVDGNYVDGGPLVESLPNAGETQTHIWHGVYTVGVGNHTITFQLYLPCSANANQWSVRYLITTP